MLTNLPEETGLGYLDSFQAILELEMEIKPLEDHSHVPEGSQGVKRRGRRKEAGGTRPVTVPISIQQDLGMLKGRTGDTGVPLSAHFRTPSCRADDRRQCLVAIQVRSTRRIWLSADGSLIVA